MLYRILRRIRAFTLVLGVIVLVPVWCSSAGSSASTNDLQSQVQAWRSQVQAWRSQVQAWRSHVQAWRSHVQAWRSHVQGRRSHVQGRQSQAQGRQGWTLTWSDEFDGSNGSKVDLTKWSFDIGGGGWGNNELQTYTDRPANARLEDGALVITARKEVSTGPDKITRNYTSARLLTKNSFTQTYGRFEARIKVPYGQGIWPAFWMLGNDIDTAGWPKCGEIDIMEHIGKQPSIIYGTIHGPGYSGANGVNASYTLPSSRKFSDDYHTFAVEWEPKVIRFYVDGLLYKTRTPADLPVGEAWVFNHPFFLILNVAVGGNWPGDPDATTVFPQTMNVDYVRVYQRAPSLKRATD